jgi:single-strand DNA-binding protein
MEKNKKTINLNQMNTAIKQDQILHMNHVNIIGKISSEPKVSLLPGGRRVVNFSLATKEHYLDKDGNLQVKQDWHRLTAFGRWVSILEELCAKGINVAVEGRLVSRFYKTESGERKMFSEIEVNDLIIL